MATNGVLQLTKLTVRYCKHSGSSAGVREWVNGTAKVVEDGSSANGYPLWATIKAFAMQNPEVQIDAELRNGYGKVSF
jgi:hypothetical protein